MSKTPQFDRALDEILRNLKPHTRTCQQCDTVFEVFQEDIDMYHMLRVSPPTLCPMCRKRRRMAFFLRTFRFYKPQCQAPSHSEKVVSQHPSDSPLTIYDYDYWLSDRWDPLDYGREYKEDKDFVDQFRELIVTTPLPPIDRPFSSVNCDYAIGGFNAKDCYYAGGLLGVEHIYYGFVAAYSKECVDVTEIVNSELCYEAIDAEYCYNCSFVQDCMHCVDSAFLFDCRNCQNCFGCTNLRNKQYCWFNEQVSKEEYRKRREKVFLGDRSVLNKIKKEFDPLYKAALRRALDNKNTINSLGNKMRGCKNCFRVFFALKDAENIRYSDYFLGIKDSMDVFGAGKSVSLLYEVESVSDSDRIKMSWIIRGGSSGLEYCLNLANCQNCFGCVGLRNKKYCILNRQYLENEYWKLLDVIKIKMLSDGEYGEFFSPKWKLHPYNNSIAQWEFPLTKQEAEKLGYWWKDEERSEEQTLPTLRAHEVPVDIREVEDDILKHAIVCEQTGMLFRIIKPELEFYKKQGITLPTIHPRQRIRNRYTKRTAFQLWDYVCPQCGQKTYTAYTPEQQKRFKIWCETCYLKEII
ncbi:hypothetical protein MYX06_00095 [Patescibacteria group bacterium AH-259-L05]|nr:hypothetical protein [Patescibacteria group bacterium AH-259-L05]